MIGAGFKDEGQSRQTKIVNARCLKILTSLVLVCERESKGSGLKKNDNKVEQRRNSAENAH